MESLTALALTCNVVQITRTAIKIATSCKEIQTKGSTKDHQTLSIGATELGDSCAEIKSALSSIGVETVLTPEQHQLCKVATDSGEAAQELSSELQKLSLSPGGSRFSALRQTGEVLFKHGRIEELATRFRANEQALNTRMLAFLLQQSISLQLTTQSTSLELRDQLQSLVEKLDKRLSDNQSHDHKCRELRQALAFSGMGARQNNLVDRGAEASALHTCDWIFAEMASNGLPEPGFAEWLRCGDELFWVVGKPGSGKSTLMQYVASDPRSVHLLSERYSPPPVISTFYFWSGGTTLEKSIQGCLRSITVQILAKDPAAYTTSINDNPTQNDERLSDDWSLLELRLLLERLVPRMSRKLVVFIDGLDEAADKEDELCGLLSFMRELGVKLCISSRPSEMFRSEFPSCKQIQVQDFTRDSIKTYVSQKLQQNDKTKHLFSKDNKSGLHARKGTIIDTIIEKLRVFSHGLKS